MEIEIKPKARDYATLDESSEIPNFERQRPRAPVASGDT